MRKGFENMNYEGTNGRATRCAVAMERLQSKNFAKRRERVCLRILVNLWFHVVKPQTQPSR
jgi:hypothetical protein